MALKIFKTEANVISNFIMNLFEGKNLRNTTFQCHCIVEQ